MATIWMRCRRLSASLLISFLIATTGTNATLVPGPPGAPNPAQTVLSTCVLPQKLSMQLWDQLHIDDYIKNYPNGRNLSVEAFARENGAQNFVCGIGQKCNVGELCYPVQGLAWYVLFAVQEFNLLMNSLYKAVGTTMDLVRFTTASLLMDLIPPPPKKKKSQVVMNILEFTTALTVSLSVGLFITMGALAADSAWLMLSEFSAWFGAGSSSGLSISAIGSIDARARRQEPVSAFEYWSQFTFYFSQAENSMHQGIANSLQATLNAGISSTVPGPNSLATLLAHGRFLEARNRKSMTEIEASLKDVTQVRALVILLKSMNAFVTRGSEPCKGHGLNGARDEENHLSYCGPDNVMMNIVIARGDKVQNEIHNAKSIGFKYSITTEYLTKSSWECQKKHFLYYDPYQYSPLPMNATAECVANLPVCDCTRQDIQLEMKHTNIVRACREVGKLKI